jgi:hypothetical protein
MISRVRPNGTDLGGWSLSDPPGSFSPLSFLASDVAKIYSFAVVGQPQIGPLAATVPIDFTGFASNGVPNLFAAQVDSNTGLPIVVTGPGNCFVATSTRINDPMTGAILTQFVPTVTTFVSEAIEPVPEPATALLLITSFWIVAVRRLR